VWQRVGQHGWTPERLFAALTCVLALGYGLSYTLAVLRGAGWMERIRQANIHLALAAILLAGLWLTPILNAERISAKNQLARFDAGKTAIADLDVEAIRGWGTPGEEVLAVLEARAKETGQEALAARLAGTDDPTGTARAEAIRSLSALMPVQPAGATGTRDTLIAGADDYLLRDWAEACRPRPGVATGCLMVVADLLPSRPGEEAVLLLVRNEDYVEILGLYLDDAGRLASRAVQRADGRYVNPGEMQALLEAWTLTPPPMTQAPINQLGTGDGGLLFLP
jgi:hypothetical protein